MKNEGYINTEYFNNFIEGMAAILQEYDDISTELDTIISTLKKNWKGKGAVAFFGDVSVVRTNVSGLKDVLQTMCDMVEDCRDVFHECDSVLGEQNQEAGK